MFIQQESKSTQSTKSATPQTVEVQDQRLLELVQQAFASCPYQPLRELQYECENGVITLQGKVPSYYLKQVAQQLVLSLPDLERVENRVEVAGGVAHGTKSDWN